MVLPVQEWLDDSTLSGNLLESLRNKRNGDAVGVAALVADGAGPAFAMIRTLAENPGVPIRTPLVLPDEVDAVVLIAGNEVLDFGLDGKVWRRSER